MTTIDLSHEFMPLVLGGAKRTTVRKGNRQYPLGAGQLVSKRISVPIFIRGLRHCRFDELTEEDAWADGFDALMDLEAALRRFYPSIRDEDECTIVEFSLASRVGLSGSA